MFVCSCRTRNRSSRFFCVFLFCIIPVSFFRVGVLCVCFCFVPSLGFGCRLGWLGLYCTRRTCLMNRTFRSCFVYNRTGVFEHGSGRTKGLLYSSFRATDDLQTLFIHWSFLQNWYTASPPRPPPFLTASPHQPLAALWLFYPALLRYTDGPVPTTWYRVVSGSLDIYRRPCTDDIVPTGAGLPGRSGEGGGGAGSGTPSCKHRAASRWARYLAKDSVRV